MYLDKFLSSILIPQNSKIWVISYGNWKHILFNDKVVIMQQLWDPWQWAVTLDPLRPLALLYCFVSFAFLFRHNTLHSQSITHPRFALLFHLLSSFPHFSSPEKFSASEVVKLSSRRHELTVEICHLWSVLPILPFWVCSSLSPSLFSMSIVVFVMIFFFLLKFIFQDFVEYWNVWPCWVCSLCALSKSYFLLSTSQYWERFENVSFFFFFWV